jgi:hypothetical protein
VIRRLLSFLSRGWAGSVYAAVVPVAPGVPRGAATFLEDLWEVAPARVTLATALGALAIALSPPLVLGRLTVFPRLAREEQEALLARLAEARPYLVRLLFYGVKSMALVAVLRDPAIRGELGLDAASEARLGGEAPS